jgi:hypothetical protein
MSSIPSDPISSIITKSIYYGKFAKIMNKKYTMYDGSNYLDKERWAVWGREFLDEFTIERFTTTHHHNSSFNATEQVIKRLDSSKAKFNVILRSLVKTSNYEGAKFIFGLRRRLRGQRGANITPLSPMSMKAVADCVEELASCHDGNIEKEEMLIERPMDVIRPGSAQEKEFLQLMTDKGNKPYERLSAWANAYLQEDNVENKRITIRDALYPLQGLKPEMLIPTQLFTAELYESNVVRFVQTLYDTENYAVAEWFVNAFAERFPESGTLMKLVDICEKLSQFKDSNPKVLAMAQRMKENNNNLNSASQKQNEPEPNKQEVTLDFQSVFPSVLKGENTPLPNSSEIVVMRHDQYMGLLNSPKKEEAKPEKEKDKPEIPEAYACVVCLDETKEVLIEPCGHLALCGNCANGYNDSVGCPMCRGPITKKRKIFT